MGIQFVYAFPGTPKQNGHVEWKFTTLFNNEYAMLNCGNFSSFLRNGLWPEAPNTATLLKNSILTPNRVLSPFQQFFGKGQRRIQL